jgi:hypothetical protein
MIKIPGGDLRRFPHQICSKIAEPPSETVLVLTAPRLVLGESLAC